MPSAEVGESSKTPLQFCTDLQSLIFITLNYVLNPLRRELRKSHEYSDILNLEIQDGEQISEICNAEEDVADSILVQYPSSLSCFRCLGIDEDTIHGLLYIREITFLKLLDMQENEVRDLLSVYCVPLEDIDRILMGLSKIRCNIDLLESDQPFEDDTRNLIKQVIKLTEKSEPSPGFEKPDGAVLLHCDPLSSPPLYVTGPQEFGENCMSPSNNLSNGMVSSQRLLRSGRFSSDHGIQIDHLIDRTSPPIPSVRSGSESHPSSCFSINPPNLQFSFNHPPYPLDLSTQTLNRNSRRSKTPVPFHRFCRALSPVSHRANSSNLAKSNILDGVLSVPSTPAPRVFGTPIHQKSPAKGAVMSTSYTSATDRFFQKGSTNRDKAIKMPATPPSKHKIKFTFPLHRSKSHESNLASKIYLPSSNGAGKTSHTTSKNPGRVANVFHTPDSHSPAANDSNVFCFSTPTHIANAPPSPKFNSRPEHHPSDVLLYLGASMDLLIYQYQAILTGMVTLLDVLRVPSAAHTN
ncbi:unnamed protein product [Mesocestoides corti]|uniref:Protein kinase domain-containing protein n=1 Tax=Mesocestoides corti TaxID=53468 RepID=A0A0R3UEE2_MESCO|nr:unnamed protein product [Mesocestoides corti]